MIRMVLALVVMGVLLTALSRQPVMAQPEKVGTPKMDDKDKDKDKDEKKFKVQVTTPWWSWDRTGTVVGLLFLAMILFQLIMLRSTMERLNEKMGAGS